MRRTWHCTVPCILLWAVASATGEDAPVRAWQDSLQIPTYPLGEASPIPDFAILSLEPANYPYALLKNLTQQRKDRTWRTLNLENEYLLCRVLPDLGGHLYSCRDKRNGREMFYANPVIKPGDIGLRGAWTALGIESNFPLGHARDSISPVDFALRSDPDGSGRAILEDVDRVTGMQWRVEFILRPASTVLEQRVTLYNRTPQSWPYYWWANAGIAFDDPATRMILPARVVSTHTTPPEIVPWPGADKDGTPVAGYKSSEGWFAYGSREPFFAVYKPASRSGVAHFADPKKVLGKKLWLWGDEDSMVRRDLTDAFPSYIEMQGGLFEDQNMFEFLLPQQVVHFSEFWIPVFDLDGVSRVTADAILHLERRSDASRKPVLRVELSATHRIHGATLRLLNGGQTMFEARVDLDPAAAYSKILEDPAGSPYTIQLRDSAGKILLEHVEGKYDADDPDKVRVGPVPAPDWKRETASAILARGNFEELHHQRQLAWQDDSGGLKRFPSDRALTRAAGNLALNLNLFDQAAALLARAVAADPSDQASAYGLGLAQAMLGHDTQAQNTFYKVPFSSSFSSAAAFEQALIAAREKNDTHAIAILKTLSAPRDAPVRIGGLEVALLRRSGHTAEALERLKALYAADPADSFLRFERVLLGSDDPDLWIHLGVDGDRVLALADEYLNLGSDEDALRLLSHSYPPVSAEQIEPGAVPVTLDPLILYYRAFVRERLGQDGAADLRQAANGFTRYVFPYRWNTAAVLNSALRANPSDSHAHFLLARLLLYQFKPEEALAQWQEARKINPAFPELDDLGRALTEVKKNAAIMTMKEAREPAAHEAMKPVSTPTVAVAPKSSSPEDIASAAMLHAAAGSGDTAFDPKTFTVEKQPDSVRQAWIEVQLQSLMHMAHAGKCDAALDGLFRLGNEDTGLAFTMYGFDRYMKLAHFQYYAGGIEADCHQDKNAKKRWTKVSKMTESLPSPEFVFPILAAARLDPDSGSSRIAATLEAVRAALAKAEPAARPALIFAEAMLLSAAGKGAEATLQFEQAIKSGDLMIQYLSLTEISRPLPLK